MAQTSVLQPVDDDARRLAGTLLRSARFAALATLDRDSGSPMASRVSLATEMDGAPIFLISRLSGHFSALEADPRASLLVGEPGAGDPLAHPRMTVFGRAVRIDGGRRGHVRARFLARQPKAALYVDFADFAFWRLEVEGASLNGGFGKAFAMARSDLVIRADPELEAMEAGAVDHMNEDHPDAVALYAEVLLKRDPGPWRLACFDPQGLDLICGDQTARLWFDPPLRRADALRQTLAALAKRARQERDGACAPR